MTSRPGFSVRSRMRNASASAAGRSLDPAGCGIPARAASALARSKTGGSITVRTRRRRPARRSNRRGGSAGRNVRAHSTAQREGVVPPRLALHALGAVEHEHDVARRELRPIGWADRRIGRGPAGPERPRQRQRHQGEQRHPRKHQEQLGQADPAAPRRPSSRNCIAPQSITSPRRRLSRWMISGRAAPREAHQHRGVENSPAHRISPRAAIETTGSRAGSSRPARPSRPDDSRRPSRWTLLLQAAGRKL